MEPNAGVALSMASSISDYPYLTFGDVGSSQSALALTFTEPVSYTTGTLFTVALTNSSDSSGTTRPLTCVLQRVQMSGA